MDSKKLYVPKDIKLLTPIFLDSFTNDDGYIYIENLCYLMKFFNNLENTRSNQFFKFQFYRLSKLYSIQGPPFQKSSQQNKACLLDFLLDSTISMCSPLLLSLYSLTILQLVLPVKLQAKHSIPRILQFDTDSSKCNEIQPQVVFGSSLKYERDFRRIYLGFPHSKQSDV